MQCQSPTSRHVKMLGKFVSVDGEFVVHQVVELLWARPLVVSVGGVCSRCLEPVSVKWSSALIKEFMTVALMRSQSEKEQYTVLFCWWYLILIPRKKLFSCTFNAINWRHRLTWLPRQWLAFLDHSGFYCVPQDNTRRCPIFYDDLRYVNNWSCSKHMRPSVRPWGRPCVRQCLLLAR